MFQWLRKALGSTPRQRSRARAARPRLECLEGRYTPTSAFWVNSLGDEGDYDPGDGYARIAPPDPVTGATITTLRAAIEEINASVGESFIGFDITGTIALTSALPALDDDMEIEGPGSDVLIIDGGGSVRLFEISTGKSCSISNVSLTGGYVVGSGGAIWNRGTLVLSSVEIYDNYASSDGGAICSDASTSLTVAYCDIRQNTAGARGGAIANFVGSTTALVLYSDIYQNNASSGGGIYSSGDMYVDSCDIYYNTATLFGGGIYVSVGEFEMYGGILYHNDSSLGDGGGIYISGSGSAYFDSVDITENTADDDGGGFYVASGLIEINGGSLSDNGAGNAATEGGAADFDDGDYSVNLQVHDSIDWV